MRRSEAFLGSIVVAVSAAVSAAHTVSHTGQHVMSLPAWQLTYMGVVIYAAPVVAAVLLWTRFRRPGAWLLAASMAGSLAFGLLYHFLVSGPHNVFTQPRTLEDRLRGHRGAALVASDGRRLGRSKGCAENTPGDEQVRQRTRHSRVLGRAMSEGHS